MRSWMLVALMVCAGTSAAYAQRDSDADAISKIVAMEHVWAEAYVEKDPRALAAILDDAFVCVTSDGKVLSKADVLADVKISTGQQILTEAMMVHLHGLTAIVTGSFQTKGVEHGKAYVRRERFVDTWIYKSGQWVSITTMVSLAGD
jgi:ketosteroid isomerase-like protein